MNWLLGQEFWFWVLMGVATIYVGKKTGKTISQWVQSLFGKTIDYIIMALIVFLVWKYPSAYQQCDKTTMLVRGIVLGHWFWNEEAGGIITKGWIVEKLKYIFGKLW